MHSIGSRWPHDKRAIFVKHRATLLCVRALCQIRMAIPNPNEDASTAVGAAPQDDPYLLPSIMASVVLHDGGYDETNLGPNTPIDVLTDSVEIDRPDLVWLALTNPIRSSQQSREIDNLAKKIHDYRGKLLIGGNQSATYANSFVKFFPTMAEFYRKAISVGN